MPKVNGKKIPHGKYVLLTKKRMYIFSTILKRGRAIEGKKAKDFDHKDSPELVKKILLKGEWTPHISRKEATL